MAIADLITRLNADIALNNEKYKRGDEKNCLTDSQYDALLKLRDNLTGKDTKVISQVSESDSSGRVTPMLSLAYSTDIGYLNKFNEKIISKLSSELSNSSVTTDLCYSGELKYDGVAIELIYYCNKLIKAYLKSKEDITINVTALNAVPLRIDNHDFNLNTISIRGELYFTHKEFKKYAETSSKQVKNPRNAIAGLIRNSNIPYGVSASFSPYSICAENEANIKSQGELYDWFNQIGFSVNDDNYIITRNIEDIKEWFGLIVAERNKKKLDFDIDGIVVKVDDFSYRKMLGENSTEPKWAMAFKFQPLVSHSRVKAIVHNVSMQGRLVPLAFIDPTEIGGITAVTLYLSNYNKIKNNDIRIGDVIQIKRSSDVICVFDKVIKTYRDKDIVPYSYPTKCPSCGSDLHFINSDYHCLSDECLDKFTERLLYLFKQLSKKQYFGFKLNRSICEKLFNHGYHNVTKLVKNWKPESYEIFKNDSFKKESLFMTGFFVFMVKLRQLVELDRIIDGQVKFAVL